MGLCLAARGQHAEARQLLLDAEAHVVEVADTNRWIQTFVIDGHCRLLLEVDDRHGAAVVADRLLALASAAAMPEVVARAQLHRARLGVDGALDAARLSAEGLDNPELHTELERMAMTVG
jgi:MoxR-like ATPase